MSGITTLSAARCELLPPAWESLTEGGEPRRRLGFGVMIPFFSSGLYIGPIARALGGADIAMTVGLPVAALAYVLLYRSVDLDHEPLLIESVDRDLEPADL